jgi:hypothetical protein
VAPDVHIDPALVKLSFGTLSLSGSMAVAKTAPGVLTFIWDVEAVQDGHVKDQVMMVAYDIEHGKAYFNTLGQFRGVGMDTLNIDPTAGRTYHIYAAFMAADRSRQSESVYLGMVGV